MFEEDKEKHRENIKNRGSQNVLKKLKKKVN